MIAVGVGIGFVFALRMDLGTGSALMGVYLIGAYAPGVILQSKFSENSEATWIFDAAPLVDRGPFVSGAMTSLLTTFLAPVLGVVCVSVIVIEGLDAVLDVLFAGSVSVLLAALSARMFGRQMPFSQKVVRNAAEGYSGIMLLLMTLVGLGALAHWGLRQIPILFLPAFAIVGTAALLAARSVTRLEFEPPRRGR